MANPFIIEAIKELRALSADIKQQERAKTAFAELTSTGVINEEEAKDYMDTITRHGTVEATEVAVEVIKQAKSANKTASFGKPVLNSTAPPDSDPGNRFAEHDADFMNYDFGG